MLIKGIIDEDFVNYKEPSMFIAFPSCTFKCEKECGVCCCQNSDLAKQKDLYVEPVKLIERYINNKVSKSIVCGGLEPMDSFIDLLILIDTLRGEYHCNDTVVIYTGYKKDEVCDKVDRLSEFGNIIVKYGRFVPNSKHRFDDVLGVELASENQYAEVIT